MNIVWTIVDVEKKSQPNKSGNGELEFIAVTYKSTGRDGRVSTSSKSLYKVYANADVYEALSNATKGDEIGLRMEKNDKGFWDVVALADAPVAAPASAPAANRTSPANGSRGTVSGSTYPTAEERAGTQRSIQRQSSLAQAVSFVNANKEGYVEGPTVDDVLAVADLFVSWVNKSE